ncbi:SsrA-binding protein [Candidatus Falkowbacteria bacterium RIFOXYC2_FULL_47_12]|uniref:SsrA-binding protein n=2 Tax=Candidatus Falkowiibacteriota TaxID=1752728 RepID=A0A1F5TN57_9BACT|nr:MAG: SsrA-binding protein [Candidatus Falkowbacteria bacterium RIFOXYA2_FULL_47_9]OGF40412.1 MAG: SsrA-binding protein [Candidatus Falkowbacteria bacterium RIFOXYC2_FULL_47_12]
MPDYAVNKRARFDYEILETLEAGLVLYGHEVKSIKTGHISLKNSFVTLKNTAGAGTPEAYLTSCHIPLYKHAGKMESYEPTRPRKLLLKRSQIKQLIGKTKEKGLTLVPLKVYNKHRLIKLAFGVGKGKKKIDKRESIKKRETERKLQRFKKQY